jgi:hypothetical protein
MPPAADGDDGDGLDGAHEPLIAADHGQAHISDDDGGEQAATWFVWQLSLTAAMSGLQFGYECAPPPSHPS